jgi:hypothetical protein
LRNPRKLPEKASRKVEVDSLTDKLSKTECVISILLKIKFLYVTNYLQQLVENLTFSGVQKNFAKF